MLLEISELIQSSPSFIYFMGISGVIALVTTFATTAISINAAVAALMTIVQAGYMAYQRISRDFEGRGNTPNNSFLANKAAGKIINITNSSAPRSLLYGKDRLGGPIIFAEHTGSENQYLHLVVAHASHECKSIEKVWLNDNELSLDANGFNTESQFGDNVRVKKHLGKEDQSADSDLSVEADKWSDDHRLQGICYTYTRLEWDQDKFGGIGLPEITVELKGNNQVFDPRTRTYKYTTNPALCIRDYLVNNKLGLGASVDEINNQSVKSAANECDESVTNDDGSTENRYTLNGVIRSNEIHRDNIRFMSSSMAGAVTYTNGEFHVLAGAHRNSGFEYNENDIVSDIGVQSDIPIDQKFNSVRGSYIDPDQNYQAVDFTPIQNQEYIKDDKEQKWKKIEFPFTQSNTMAKRLARIRLRKNRNPIIVSATFTVKAYKNKVGDIISLSLDRMDWYKKKFEIISWKLTAEGTGSDASSLRVKMELKERPSSVYQNEQEGLSSSTGDVALRNPNSLSDVTGFAVTSDPVEYEDGSIQPRFKLTWDKPSDIFIKDGGFMEIQSKRSSNSEWLSETTVNGDQTRVFVMQDIESGINYDFRIRARNIDGGQSDWTKITDKTSGGDTTGPGTGLTVTSKTPVGLFELDYDSISDKDRNYYEIKVSDGTSFDASTATKLDEHDSTKYIIHQQSLEDLNFSGDITFGVRAVDRSDNSASSWDTATVNISGSWNRELAASNLFINEGTTETVNLSKTYQFGIANVTTIRNNAVNQACKIEYKTNGNGNIDSLDITNPSNDDDAEVHARVEFFGAPA